MVTSNDQMSFECLPYLKHTSLERDYELSPRNLDIVLQEECYSRTMPSYEMTLALLLVLKI